MTDIFDFEWTKRNLFYDAYTRINSYFSNSDLASSGIPQGAELALLEPWRKELPPALFTQAFTLPVTDGSGNNRDQLRRALDLLRQAGWQVKDRKLVNAEGQAMGFTILVSDPTLERPSLPYAESLRKLGIDARVRTVDPAQYQRLTDDLDFDMTMMVYLQDDVPGNELRDYWSCAAAKSQGSSNLAGICDPAVDALIEKVITAQDREALQTAARALDRILLWRQYMVPNWGSQEFRIAVWDRFGYPDAKVRQGVFFDSWWVDPAKAAATDAARR
jgi:microcin C transport system substrate-binding protein